jgi:serine/threonine protein kinase
MANNNNIRHDTSLIVSITVPTVILVLLTIVLLIVVGITLFACRKRLKAFFVCQQTISIRSDNNNHGNGELTENGLYTDSTMATMEPVSLSDETTITCTSGSGAGMPFLVKRTIARSMTLGESIGGGRFGQVYIGYYQGEKYAVKKFFSKDEQSWFHESDIYNTYNLRHENILTCFATDMLSNNGVTELWLITQYYPRGSLFEELNRDALTPLNTMKLILSICRGLMYLHMEFLGTQGKPSIAHRDIKSKNILVKNDCTCCIADFGLALAKTDNTLMFNKAVMNVRQGTKRYMSPEILSETINVSNFESFLRSDMYSFGLVMWEICRRCENENGKSEEYAMPFQSLVPSDPSFEDMKDIILDRNITLEIPSRWNSFKVNLFKLLKLNISFSFLMI